MHPLEGSQLKIVRAKQHIKLLRAKIGRHIKKYTQEIVTADSDQNSSVSSNRLTMPVPPYFSTYVGDCVTNARAAIDYVMWELASKYFSPADIDLTTTDGRKITAFPLFNDPADVGKPNSPHTNRFNRLKNLKLPAPIIDEIKAVQPYNGGYEPLWLLHELVNTDKHRMPLLTTGGFAGGAILDTWLLKELDLSKGVYLGTFTISATGDAGSVTIQKGDVEMKPQSTIFITWQDVSMPREPVDVTLENIVTCIEGIIPRFAQFL